MTEEILREHLSELLSIIRMNGTREESVRKYVQKHVHVHPEFFDLAATMLTVEELRQEDDECSQEEEDECSQPDKKDP